MEHVRELRRLFSLESAGRQLVMDLMDVTLIERDAIEYLACCEADGIKLENCPAYVREWIDIEWGRSVQRSR